ncbi:MAG TPA: NHLP bacteriocin export ABC transporter permease/ATPase subunit [Gemmatimonadaceae bacterium]|nr:NHLP bacteriocin export ABC transporter permease/ATPase subunit [Gemmatimonadaceae bacterium]
MTNLRELPESDDALPLSQTLALFADAETQLGGSDKPFRMDNDLVWLVEHGEVDVFSAPISDAPGSGSRTHLFRARPGQAVFGVGSSAPDATRMLVAVGTSGSRLRRLPQATLRARAWRSEYRPTVHAIVDAWVQALCDGMTRGVAPKECAELDAGTEVKVPEPTTARPRRGVMWVRHLEGHSHLLGQESLTVNGTGFVPISRPSWFRVTEPSRLILLETASLPHPDELWGGLTLLHDLVLRYATLLESQSAASAAERMRRKALGNRAALRGACASLVATMRPGTPEPLTSVVAAPDDAHLDPVEARHEALFAACALVGRALDVPVRRYASSEDGSQPRDPLAAIARASRLRTRSVLLRDDWWQHDNGHLLATFGEDKRPVALIRGTRGYTLHDPMFGTTAPLDATSAALLQPIAHTLYRPFPDRPLNLLDVLRLGVRGCASDFGMVFTMGLVAALLGLVPPMATGVVFNSIVPGAQRLQLVEISVVLAACAISTALFNLVRGLALLRVETRMSATIQAAVWDRLLSLPMPFFRPYAAGDLATRAMGIDAIRQVISGTTVSAILGGVFSLVNFGLMFSYSSVMAWRATLLIAVAVAVTAFGSWLQLKHQRGIASIQSKASGLVLQLLSSITKLRVAGAEITAFTLWARRFAEQRQLTFRARMIGNAVSSFHAAFPTLAYMLLFWTAIPLVHGAQPTIRTGDFLAFLSAYGACQGALLGTCVALLGTLNVIPLYELAQPILVSRPEGDLAKSDPGVLTGNVEVQAVTFRYAPDMSPVMHGLSFQVRPGEFVALVGPSGAGKSTILRLLLGFETPESGAIYYDGQDLAGVDIQAVRRQIGVVLQNGKLLAGDIFSNIVGTSPLTINDAWAAARMAGFAEDVEAMPMGMHTVVSESGGTLSGGQRQRLMIARALVHRPRLLFFDEATSALDNRTQAIVSSSLEQLHATRIVVAHRLSTIVNADRICVIARGQIVQSGKFDDLMKEPGIFAELAKRQLA